MEDIDTSPAFQRLQNKPDIPTIDFSMHTMEDGSMVSTKERVIKDVPAPTVAPPTDDEFWSKERPGLPDINFLRITSTGRAV
ncbi:unnamed protein product [Absidia cylindrospora]